MNWFEKLAKGNFEFVLKSYFKNKQINYLEVGTYLGDSLKFIFQNVNVNEASVIDTFDDFNGIDNQLKVFTENIKDFIYKIKIYHGKSQDNLVKLINNYYDFIYIDADHTSNAVLIDGILSFGLLKINGIMIFDDYLWIYNGDHTPDEFNPELNHPNNPYTGINKFLEIYADKIIIILKNWQVIIQKIKD